MASLSSEVELGIKPSDVKGWAESLSQEQMSTAIFRRRSVASLKHFQRHAEVIKTQAMDLLDDAVISEEKFIKGLEQLLMLLHHPGIQGNVLSLEKFIKNVKDLLTLHQNFKGDLSSAHCSIACAFFNFLPYVTVYLDYCCYLKRIHVGIEKVIGQCEQDLWKRCGELLQAPILHIYGYEALLYSLIEAFPEQDKISLQEILEALQKTVMEMKSICNSTENALKLLWIQKCLMGRQPKIFSPERIFLKEGSLLKFEESGKKAEERVLFLFNDILLICKRKKKFQDFYEKSSLKCCAVVPLPCCSALLLPRSKWSIPLLEISWQENSYLLCSDHPEDLKSWGEELRKATKYCREAVTSCNKENKGRTCSLKRAAVIHRKVQPAPCKRPTDAVSSSASPTKISATQSNCFYLRDVSQSSTKET